MYPLGAMFDLWDLWESNPLETHGLKNHVFIGDLYMFGILFR